MYPNVQMVVDRIAEVVELHKDFSQYTLEVLKPPAGPYAIFHHHGHFLERLQNVNSIIKRMGKARVRITTLHEREDRRTPKNGVKPGKPYPKYLQKIASESRELTQLMRLDNETLYVFGNLALDQWAYTVAYSLGLDNPEEYTFHYLISKLQAKSLDPKLKAFRERHFGDAVWLYYQLRFYRNNFIEHVDRPWQRGSTMSAYGDDFKFFIPTPPGWIPEKKLEEMFQSVEHLFPAWLKKLPKGHWQKRPRASLEAAIKQINEIDKQADREKLWNVWAEIGGSTISFDIIGGRLAKFFHDSTQTLFEQMESNPDNINLGRSPYGEAS